jgi:DNA-binding transcriptional MerR regulator
VATAKDTAMRIKELARATGLDVDTIRYYERQGLLPAPARRDNGYRDCAPAHLERLAFIRHCRALEMPLADIRRLLGALDAPATAGQDVDALVQAQLDRVRVRLQSMQALEQQLLLLLKRCNGQHPPDGACGILQELVAAAHGEACACHAEAHPA